MTRSRTRDAVTGEASRMRRQFPMLVAEAICFHSVPSSASTARLSMR
jgi:hypothetical protein